MSGIRTRNKRLQVGFSGIVSNTDESVLSHEYAVQCLNFVIENGVLKGSIGIDKAKGYFKEPNRNRHEYPEFPADKSIKRIFHYRRTNNGEYDDRIVVHLQDGYMWYTSVFSNDVWHKVESLRLYGDVNAINYNYNGEDVLLLASATDGLFIIKDTTAYYCSSAPKFCSIAVHSERVFGAVNGVQNQVWFSKDFDPANWSVSSSDAGFINFADGLGDVIKVVSFLNYLYIFREYGILRLTAFGEQSDFILKKVFTDTGRIYKDTIVECGDKIVFYAEGGIFVFDGYNVSRIANQIPEILNKTAMCAAYLDDCYYLACRIVEDDFLNNAVIRYDFSKKSFSILYGVQIRWLCSAKMHNGASVFCAFDNAATNVIGEFSNSGCVLSVPTHKKYVSPKNDLSTEKIKAFRSMSVICKYPVSISVNIDGKVYVYDIAGKDELQTVIIEKFGKKFGIEIESDSADALVAPISVNLDVIA